MRLEKERPSREDHHTSKFIKTQEIVKEREGREMIVEEEQR